MSCEYVVQRPAADLPQAATGALFTVSGGNVLLLGIVGTVTATLGTDTNASSVDAGGLTLATYSTLSSGLLPGSVVGGQTPGANPNEHAYPIGAGGSSASAPLVLADGAAVSLTCAASVSGQLRWTAWYAPLDPGAFMTAV